MKIARRITARRGDGGLTVFADGEVCAEFFDGETPLLRLGRMTVGGFAESQGLAAKLRRHAANDRLSGEIDGETVIPFGCEYRVRRHWKLAGNIAEATCDVAADNGGRVAALELEPLFFPIPDADVEFLVYGETEFRRNEAYSGREMIVMLRVSAPDGKTVEFYAGDDFWRHRAAVARPELEVEHRLSIAPDGVRYERRIFRYPEDVTPEKRPWRFKSLIAVGAPPRSREGDVSALSVKGCFAAPAAHRAVREFVRKLPAGTAAEIRGDFPHFCADGGHEARPGRTLEHGDLAEVFDEWVWAAGALAGSGGSCVMRTDNARFAGSIILTALASHPGETIFDEGEK